MDLTKRLVINPNRLLAKARFREQDRSSSSSSSSYTKQQTRPDDSVEINQNGKRTQASSSSSSRATATTKHDGVPRKDSTRPLPNLIGKFVDYDLSTMKNTRGGFLLDNEEEDPKVLKQRQQILELKRQRLQQAQKYGKDPSFSMDPKQNPRCKICGSVELDFQIYQIFNVPVCFKCKNENPDRFSLLTKTECKEDYLLTDPELKDTEILPHLLKANPHRSTYSNMMLYLREQVEEYSFSDKKWGSEEALDREFRRREAEKKVKKNKKFEEKLKALRKNTRTNVWHRRVESDLHVHEFEEVADRSDKKVQRCKKCGLETEFETF
ncbi:XPA protein C-terminus-domain-containing protein [Phakopsora pachyrhizi]|nr:XPA protein C-terminus-domain-containing protein [Phakopsora pachyrhizi]